METKPSFLELQRRFRADQLVLFVGAGVSQAAGLPSWSGLIVRVIEGAVAYGLEPSVGQALERARQKLAREDLIGALTTVAAALPGPMFVRLVQETLDDGAYEVPDVAVAVAELRDHLQAVITTNLDRLLERAFAGRWPDILVPSLGLGQRKGYILKLHGTRLSSESWVLTRPQYEALIHARPTLQKFLESLYLQRTLLFVGYGLRDPDFELLLGWMRTFAGSEPPRHFALMPEGSVDPEDRHGLEQAGIEVLPYPTPGGSHAEVARLLRALRDAPPSGTSAASSSPSRSSVLSSISSPSGAVHPPAGAQAMIPRERLARLFINMFSRDELNRLVSYLEEGLASDVPHASTANEFAAGVAGLLMDRGLVAAALERVARERPRRMTEIDEVRRLFPAN